MELGRDSDTGGQVNEICQAQYKQQDTEKMRRKINMPLICCFLKKYSSALKALHDKAYHI